MDKGDLCDHSHSKDRKRSVVDFRKLEENETLPTNRPLLPQESSEISKQDGIFEDDNEDLLD